MTSRRARRPARWRRRYRALLERVRRPLHLTRPAGAAAARDAAAVSVQA